MRQWISRLDAIIRERDSAEAANKQIAAANALYKAGKIKEALELYRQSLTLHKNPEIEAFLRRQGAGK